MAFSWSDINNSEHQPGKPGTRSYFQRLKDNLYALRDLLLSHTHDGTDTPVIDVGADVLRNGSFEANSFTGWDTVAYGGSLAVGTSGAMDGKYVAAITSTSVAGGGGKITTAAFTPISGGETKQFRFMVKGSTAGISSKARVIWYDADEVQVSESEIYSTASTPTSSRLCIRRIAAPEAARYCKVELTGGVVAVGTAFGTVYFDGVVVEGPALTGRNVTYICDLSSFSATFDYVIGDIEISTPLNVTVGTNTQGTYVDDASGAGTIFRRQLNGSAAVSFQTLTGWSFNGENLFADTIDRIKIRW